MKIEKLPCPVCGRESTLLDVVDLNKSCEEPNGKFLALSGIPVYYALCGNCNFCFAPEICAWPLEEFEEKIYNNEYIFVDPDYIEARPIANAQAMISIFGKLPHEIKHLDYGGGNGALAKELEKSGWNSTSYDPFVDKGTRIDQLGKFDLITAFEVFEHVPDVHKLMSNLRTLLAANGMILFTTLTTDGEIHSNQRINWWYASPRNGHISLFSKKSLAILAQNNDLNFGSFSAGFHVFFTEVPNWAAHVMRVN